MKLKCPVCGEEKRRIGLAGHLVLAHKYTLIDANETTTRLANLAK